MCFSSPKIPKPTDLPKPTAPPPILEPMEFQPIDPTDKTKKRKLGVAQLQIPLGGVAGQPSGLGIPGGG